MNSKARRWLEFVWRVVLTIVLCSVSLALNSWLFSTLEFTRGINWIHLPSGIALLATLLFAETWAAGLLLFSLVAGHLVFPDDPPRAYVGAILLVAGSYGTYLLARHIYGLDATLRNLTPARLLVLCVAYAIASPLLHHLWFALQGQQNLWQGILVMSAGNLAGSLLVIYAAKLILPDLPGIDGWSTCGLNWRSGRPDVRPAAASPRAAPPQPAARPGPAA
jgi:hypothetical protein